MSTVHEHVDLLGQPINAGDHVSFTWSQARGVRVGVITKLTKQRVRVSFTWSHENNGVKSYYIGSHITRPGDCLVLGDKLQQQLIIATLKKTI